MDDAPAALPNPRERRATPMRQHRPGPTRQYRREPIPLLPEAIMSVGVHTAVKPDQASCPKHLLDTASTETDDRELPPGHNAPLLSRNLLQPG